MTKLTETEKSWLACAIDGEGHMGLRTTGPKHNQYTRFMIANTNHKFIEKASKLTGCKITILQHTKGHLGKKTIYAIAVNKHKIVLEILEQILPYLIIKKKKAKEIILFTKNRNWNKPRGRSA